MPHGLPKGTAITVAGRVPKTGTGIGNSALMLSFSGMTQLTPRMRPIKGISGVLKTPARVPDPGGALENHIWMIIEG